MCRYENIPDPESDISLPVVTITDFATGEAGKEVILLVAGEHARELITSEIVFWLGKLLAGKHYFEHSMMQRPAFDGFLSIRLSQL